MAQEGRHHRVRRVRITLTRASQPASPHARVRNDPSVLSRWAVWPAHLPAARVCRKSSLRPRKSCATATSRTTNGCYLFGKLEPIYEHLSTAQEPKLEAQSAAEVQHVDMLDTAALLM